MSDCLREELLGLLDCEETLTLLRSRGHRTRALLVGDRFLREADATLHFLTPAEIRRAW